MTVHDDVHQQDPAFYICHRPLEGSRQEQQYEFLKFQGYQELCFSLAGFLYKTKTTRIATLNNQQYLRNTACLQ